MTDMPASERERQRSSGFGEDPRAFFDSVYLGTAPWDIGAPQPALTRLLDDRPPEGPVLDVGCGTGDLAIFLAARGLEVVGVDFVEGALVTARERAKPLPDSAAARLYFRAGDCLAPSRLGRRFGSIVDSGFLHLFEQEDRDRFVQDLPGALRPGGRYYLLAFAVEFPGPSPRLVTEEELRRRFSADRGWKTLEVRPAEFLSAFGPVPAIAGCFELAG